MAEITQGTPESTTKRIRASG